jgi:hypothetical protein
MTFQKVAVNYGQETEADEQGNYSCTITIGIKSSSDLIPPFSKDIVFESSNSQTGYEVDAAREKAIKDFIEALNK